MKNYRIYFMGGKTRDVTAEQAAAIYRGLESNAPRMLLDGDIFMAHQITSIERIKGQESKDLCERYNVAKAPTIDTFLSTQKQLG